jgi:TonB-dependent SusC/RagA subfamily outer membrane receptor
MRTKIFFLILLSVLSVNSLTAQKHKKKITITGYVVDKNQFPVANASILIDNEKSDVVSDIRGYFKVKVKPSALKIGILTSISDVTEEAIDGRTRINFSLTSNPEQQINFQNNYEDKEQINIGYGTINKSDLISPANRIDGTNKKFDSYNSIYDMIRGQVPGVQIYGNKIKIQNSSSFLMSTSPLFIVDGVMVESISYIPPQLVESIEVLKGPSASIYGLRGANGVILITLRR